MNLLYIVFGMAIAFAFVLYLLSLANLSHENRHKQLFLPLLAFLVGLVLLGFDSGLSRLYQQVFSKNIPSFLPYIQLLVNLSFIILFLVMKWIWKISKSLPAGKTSNRLQHQGKALKKVANIVYPSENVEQLKEKFFEAGTVSLVYLKSRGQIFLKKEWTYLSVFFTFASILPAVLLFLLIIACVYQLPLIPYLPKYPVISILLLLEIAWFLDGRRSTLGEGSLEGKDAVSSKVAVYEELFKQYKELWPERLLAGGNIRGNEHIQQRTHHFSYENLTQSHEHQMFIDAICAQLKKKNLMIDESYTTMLSEIIQEKDIIIEDCLYKEFSPYLFPALYHLLTKNKLMLVVAPNQSAVEDAEDWISRGISDVSGLEQVWKVSAFTAALEQNSNADVILVSPDILEEKRFMQYLGQLEKTKNLETMIILQADKILPTFASILHTFNVNVRELIGKKPQYIVMTEWQEGLEHTIRNVLQCVPGDFAASSNMSRNLHYLVWKKEGEKWFQQNVLPNISHRELEAEAVLALPALKANIDPVHFISHQRTNVKASLHEILDAKKSLFDFGFQMETLDQFLKMVKIHRQNLTVPVDDFTFMLIRDTGCNLVDALYTWKGTGREAEFVHVISPPYLLRDYLADQLEFFMSAHRTIAPMAPRVSKSIWSIAYYLLNRLCHFSISEEEVEYYLIRAKISSYRSVVEGVHQLFTDAFGQVLEYRLNLESEEMLIFDRSRKDFVKKTCYSLPNSLLEKILPKDFRFVEIKHHNQRLLKVMEGHFYQQYLPGQFHSFNGELYKIEKVDLERGTVEVSYEPLFENKYYRQMKDYRIREEKILNDKHISYERYEMNITEIQANVQNQTDGFVEFNQLLNLKSVKVHPFSKEEKIQTEYENGRLLRIKIQLKEGQLKNITQIEFTLTLLLNELFLSLFPETHHFIKACFIPDDSFFNKPGPLTNKLQLITPTIRFNVRHVQMNQITLYFVEDSPIHMGLLEAVRDQWEKIFDIVNDYLYWLLHESNGRSDYLYFGYGGYPDELALTETFTVLDELLTRKKLREVRTDYQVRSHEKPAAEMVSNSQTQCVFCGRMFPTIQINQLDDGRKRCLTCSQSAIDQVSQLTPLYEEVRLFFKEVYQTSLPEDIELLVLSAAELHRISGLPFIPEAGHPRLTGKACMDELGNLKVLIENGAPKIHTLSTLAHELTHIWQYENLELSGMTLEELEGFASWVEVHMMTQLGEIPFANMLKQQLQSREDEYGKGYRLIVERLAQLHDNATPFELFAAAAVGM